MKRRDFVKAAAAGSIGFFPLAQNTLAVDPLKTSGRRVVIVGGGFGGAVAARTLKQQDATIEVVLIEQNPVFTACPGSNLVLAGIRKIEDGQFSYDNLRKYGVQVFHNRATAVDPSNRIVQTTDGAVAYDKLILSPGIDFIPEDIQGYDLDKTPLVMPHAMKGAEQINLLKTQLQNMKDGGKVIITIPTTLYRCPPGPYERISLIAHWLKTNKPASKIIVLDANPEIVSKGALFKKAWNQFYKGMIDYRPNFKVIAINSANLSVKTELEEIKGDVINLIPPQRAGQIAFSAKVVSDDKRWCPVNATTFESTLQKDIFVIGDACSGAPMPKSANAANNQAKACAMNLAAVMNGKKPVAPILSNVCYSFVTNHLAMSIAGVYKTSGSDLITVPGAGGVATDYSEREATYGRAWLKSIMDDTQG